jgi:hypothetical protein
MYYQEILHIKTSNIYSINTEFEIIEYSYQWDLFQNSDDPTQLGYTFQREFIYPSTDNYDS